MASSSNNNGGYDYEFVPPLDEDFICPICHLAMRDPVQTTVCGHLFCGECLKKFHESMRHVCPVDNLELSAGQIFPDRNIKRKILARTVMCPNSGCEWIGEMSQVDKHKEECPMEKITCLLSECSLEVIRQELDDHMISKCAWRQCQCVYCDENFPFCKKKVHEDTCRRFPPKCTNNCDPNQTIPREQLEYHLENDCPLTLVECTLKEIGCEVQVPRCKLDQHLQSSTQRHLVSACKKISEMGEYIVILNREQQDLRRKNEMAERGYNKKINEMSDNIVMLNQQLEQQKQIINEMSKDIVKLSQELEQHKRVYGEKENEMAQKVPLMPREMEHINKDQPKKEKFPGLETTNKKTVLVWTVQNFRRAVEIPLPTVSPRFSVEQGGHSMSAALRSSYRRLFLSIDFCGNVRGQVWPFKKRMLITIINQEDDGHEWDITLDEVVLLNRPSSRILQFSSYRFNRSFNIEEFYQRKYVVDDRLLIQVDVVNN